MHSLPFAKVGWRGGSCAAALFGLAPCLCPGAKQGCSEGSLLCPVLLWPVFFKVHWCLARAVGIFYMRWDAFNAVGGRAGLLSYTCQLPVVSRTVLKPALMGNNGKYPLYLLENTSFCLTEMNKSNRKIGLVWEWVFYLCKLMQLLLIQRYSFRLILYGIECKQSSSTQSNEKTEEQNYCL